MPTSKPATVSPSQPLWNSILGRVANSPHTSGAMSRPRRNSAFSIAPSLRRCNRLPIRPLMPAMRPLATTNRLAARPINAPPARDDQGVKLSQSIFTKLLRHTGSDRGWVTANAALSNAAHGSHVGGIVTHVAGNLKQARMSAAGAIDRQMFSGDTTHTLQGILYSRCSTVLPINRPMPR